MAKLFQNKYRISSTRLRSWNYANEGMYFVTICTKNREYYFGKILATIPGHASLHPSEIGKIAREEWYKTVALRPDMNLQLGEFVVMPDHVHGIILIGANEFNSSNDGTHDIFTARNQFMPQSKNLASILRGYKSAVTTYARKNNITFDWQPRFHDHVIRSPEEYVRISNYIRNNPQKWWETHQYL